MTLTLTIPQINTILQALGNSPYMAVVELIAEIQKQGAEQSVQFQAVDAPKE